jgi:hypothetical protein
MYGAWLSRPSNRGWAKRSESKVSPVAAAVSTRTPLSVAATSAVRRQCPAVDQHRQRQRAGDRVSGGRRPGLESGGAQRVRRLLLHRPQPGGRRDQRAGTFEVDLADAGLHGQRSPMGGELHLPGRGKEKSDTGVEAGHDPHVQRQRPHPGRHRRNQGAAQRRAGDHHSQHAEHPQGSGAAAPARAGHRPPSSGQRSRDGAVRARADAAVGVFAAGAVRVGWLTTAVGDGHDCHGRASPSLHPRLIVAADGWDDGSRRAGPRSMKRVKASGRERLTAQRPLVAAFHGTRGYRGPTPGETRGCHQ